MKARRRVSGPGNYIDTRRRSRLLVKPRAPSTDLVRTYYGVLKIEAVRVSWELRVYFYARTEPYVPGLTKLVYNRFGIPEPQFDKRQCIKASLLNLVFLPLVGFDRKGNRIGMGKGYYDKTFSSEIHCFHAPKLVGLAHSIQETGILPNSWDIPLDAIFTEREKIPIR